LAGGPGEGPRRGGRAAPEELAQASLERQELAAKQSVDMLGLLEQNTRLTRVTQELTQRIKELTDEIHSRVASS